MSALTTAGRVMRSVRTFCNAASGSGRKPAVHSVMEPCSELTSLSPAELRRLIKQDDPRIRSTSGLAAGYQQANVAILPKQLAADFQLFCQQNPAPLPVLYCSQPGETSCPPLAESADVRTDISQYCVYEDGKFIQNVSSLQNYSNSRMSWPDTVCFYLGCSFGFEGRLRQAGVPVRNIQQGTNVSMYTTTVPCVPAGVFSCPLVVSMRPIPAGLLDTVVELTHQQPLAHGAPVHIGDAGLLGIEDLSRVTYGGSVELQPGDVPVFWACGVTAMEAIISSKPPVAFSHSPGCMFLTDVPEASASPPAGARTQADLELVPLCFQISHSPLLYSLASKRAVAKIRELEKIIGEDPGDRGIAALFVQDELLRCCLALSHCSSVAITTGFPALYEYSPPDETDGPPGAVAMASMLQSLGKEVTLVTDRRALEMYQDIMKEAVRTGVLEAAVPLVTFEGSGPDSALRFLCQDGDPSKPRYDHLVAIERSGRAADGNYYNMRGVNVKRFVDPIDDLFVAATHIPGIGTTGIGDGGNELGMGKVKHIVKAKMPKGELIACDVAADFAVTAGVSNWGGYAVACGLYLLQLCPAHQRYLRRGLGLEQPAPQEQLHHWRDNLPSVHKEESFLSTLMSFGIRSGKTAHLAMEVDGLTFHPTHSDIITRLREVTLGSAPSTAK